MSSAHGIGNAQNPFAPEAAATSGTAQTERTASISIDVSSPSSASGSLPLDQAKWSTVGSALAQALSQSDVRADKVAALQQAIAGGTYSISSSDVADKIINSLLM
ncbi:MAG TPA: flagellar biosynthesis anti-sigma factor FlgM [Acidobacteriaceae bacterium]|nr:flagellar biosynthesis anti-sigma factor FlgM [Acidobacteriaceae bacterium]